MHSSSSVPEKDFDANHTRRLHQLEADLNVEQHNLAAAQSVATARATRATSTQAAAVAAQTSAQTAARNLAAAQGTAQTIAQGVPLAVGAEAQATEIVKKVEPVLSKAHESADLLLEAIVRIGELGAQVKRRTGKNDLISSVVVNGAAQAQTDAANALNAVTLALQNTILAYTAAQEAGHASGKVTTASTRLSHLLAPDHVGFNPTRPIEGSVFEPGFNPLESIGDLARAVDRENLSILAVLDALAQITKAAAAETQAAARQAASELNSANARVASVSAATLSASSALNAASAAVA